MRSQEALVIAVVLLIPFAIAWIQFLFFGLPSVSISPSHAVSGEPHGFPAWIRLTHFVNFFFFLMLLARSGLSILVDHPRLYWGCTPKPRFGMNAFSSGLLVLAVFAGNLLMKPATTPVLRRFGFRTVLIGNGLLVATTIFAGALFSASSPTAIIVVVLFAGGLFRSMQFTESGRFRGAWRLRLIRAVTVRPPGLSLHSPLWELPYESRPPRNLLLSNLCDLRFVRRPLRYYGRV